MAKQAVKVVQTGGEGGLKTAAGRRRKRKGGRKGAVIGGARRLVGTARVHSPLGNGMDEVKRVLDTVDVLHRRRVIDARQRTAAERLLHAAERAGGSLPSVLAGLEGRGGAGGDCAPAAAVMAACADLRAARDELGARAFRLVMAVVVEGLTVGEASVRVYGVALGREADRHSGNAFRVALTDLADMWCPMARAKITGSGYVADSADVAGNQVREIMRTRAAHATRHGVGYSEIEC